jgi:hypothetical protein
VRVIKERNEKKVEKKTKLYSYRKMVIQAKFTWQQSVL